MLERNGLRMKNSEPLETLLFADDLAVLAEYEIDLQKGISNLNETAVKYRIR